MARPDPKLVVVALAVGAAAAAGARLVAEAGGVGWPEGDSAGVVLELRGVRAASAAVVGAALGAAGALLQATLRNPLASPFVLGLTSGAGLGLVIATWASYLATGMIVQQSANPVPVLTGAFGALGLVYLLGRRGGLIDPARLILVGVIVSVLCGAVTMLVQHMLPDRGMAVFTRWVMGTISQDTRWGLIGTVGAVTAAGVAVGGAMGRSLDAASLGDDEAASVGVRLGRLRSASLLIAGVLTAGSVLIAGPIGFVGLVCPHVVRLIAGPGHRTLVVGSALAGAALLVLADAAVAVIRAPAGELPVGVLTALIGAPVFIVLLRGSKL